MRRTNSKEVKAEVRRYLLSLDDELTIIDMADKFVSEYGWAISRMGKEKACIEWLRGLAIPCDYSYNDIAKLLAKWLEDTEENQMKMIEKNGDGLYWLLMAREITNKVKC